MYLRCIDRNAHEDVLFDVEMLDVHYELLVVQLLVLEVDLLLVDIEAELFLDEFLFQVLHFRCFIEEK